MCMYIDKRHLTFIQDAIVIRREKQDQIRRESERERETHQELSKIDTRVEKEKQKLSTSGRPE